LTFLAVLGKPRSNSLEGKDKASPSLEPDLQRILSQTLEKLCKNQTYENIKKRMQITKNPEKSLGKLTTNVCTAYEKLRKAY